MASSAKFLSATLEGAGNLAFLVAFALGGACAENLALPKDAAVLDSSHGAVVACLILAVGACLHAASYAIGTYHAAAWSNRPGRESGFSSKAR